MHWHFQLAIVLIVVLFLAIKADFERRGTLLPMNEALNCLFCHFHRHGHLDLDAMRIETNPADPFSQITFDGRRLVDMPGAMLMLRNFIGIAPDLRDRICRCPLLI